MPPPLTPRQRQILAFLHAHLERHGRTPSGPEIARRFGFSQPATAYQHLRQIAAKGYLRLEQTGRNRLLRIALLEPARRLLEPAWPRLGTIPAGPLTPFADAPPEGFETVRTLTDLLPELRPGDFFLDVDGDSMLEAGLEPGMTAVLRPGLPERPGAICAVWVDGEGGTLKRVYDHGATVELVPENPRYEARTYPAERVRIQGVLVTALAIRAVR